MSASIPAATDTGPGSPPRLGAARFLRPVAVLVAVGRARAGLQRLDLVADQLGDPVDLAPKGIELRPKEIGLARTLMDATTEDFQIEAEHDEYAHALEQVVEARLAGLEPPHAPKSRVLPPGGTVTDLMAVLERALADAREQHPKTSDAVRSTSSTRTTKKTTDRKTTGKPLSVDVPKAPARKGRTPPT
ncbi:hypothetical protein [Kitasatospora camelliae]|uniref:Ku protein n=1 Tax=Kitasatospora camelliae TaxID=3156397 RepID=A0AAU8K3U0_9ACTN